jgi:hypothetical protein
MDPSASRYALIEETGMLQNDTPPDDFVAHYYMNRFRRFRGVINRDFDELRQSVKIALEAYFDRNSVRFPFLEEQHGIVKPVAWSMNWYRLRDNNNKTWWLEDSQKADIVADFEDLRINNDFKAQVHIFQMDDQDELLIAMCLQKRD